MKSEREQWPGTGEIGLVAAAAGKKHGIWWWKLQFAKIIINYFDTLPPSPSCGHSADADADDPPVNIRQHFSTLFMLLSSC